MGPGGLKLLKEHAWFCKPEFSWDGVCDRSFAPPYQPPTMDRLQSANDYIFRDSTFISKNVRMDCCGFSWQGISLALDFRLQTSLPPAWILRLLPSRAKIGAA